jgi:hypothetical protein
MTWIEKKTASMKLLEQYRDKISPQSYNRILRVIGNSAIEDIFADENDIKELVLIEQGKLSVDLSIHSYKQSWGLE